MAQTTTDSGGEYRFENVPFATYEVLVNIDGCVQEQPTEVTLTVDNPTATNVNYSVDGTEILATGIQRIGDNTSATGAGWILLDGRHMERPVQQGIYIRNGRKMVVK